MDRRQDGVFLGFGLSIKEAQRCGIRLKRERAIVAASLVESLQLLVGQLDTSEGQSKGPLSHCPSSSAPCSCWSTHLRICRPWLNGLLGVDQTENMRPHVHLRRPHLCSDGVFSISMS